MLQGLMSDSEGLEEIERQIEAGQFVWRMDREDVHMNIEAALTDLISMVKLALQNQGLIVPGYTHLQRAQPVLLQHLLLAYVEQSLYLTIILSSTNDVLLRFLERDAGRLLDCRARVNFCPLGACALAGTGLPIDRFMTSDALGFTAPMRNRKGCEEKLLSANSITAVHLSRLGEEWVLWASEEFGFLTPRDAVSTGSRIMPQKKNPDPMELVRGKSARVVGDLVSLLVLCKGLPHAYNRDLQEDKEPVFDSVKAIVGMLEVSAEFAQNVSFNRERIQKALPAGHLDATTLADYLVKKASDFSLSKKKIPAVDMIQERDSNI
ncbi:hypothetical protein RND71_027836 [Anisodus tanguticus]|uniref:Fumarate lyase N-terminal domain-containing protein n=1 Tax=Anisodus tanguticus TaxID=243964 RepID=A0AAE1RIM0_9SOLA|nr:hypothetical protein RND71_027836 [Anisodus tanguticus]